MGVFEKEEKAAESEEEARIYRHVSKQLSGSKPAGTQPPKAARPAVNTMKPSPTHSPSHSSSGSANVPEWKRQQLDMEQRERDRQSQLEREKREKVASLPTADAAPEVNYITQVAPVSAVEAISGQRPVVVCHNCGKGLREGDSSCRNCGVPVAYNPISNSGSSSPVVKARFCIDCGAKVEKGEQRFCVTCGKTIPVVVTSSGNSDSSAAARQSGPDKSGIGVSVYGEEQDEGARERARLANLIDKPSAWVQNYTSKVLVHEEPKQPDGWVIKLSHLPASPAKPILLQVGMPNPITVFQGGDGMVSQTLTAPITKEGKIPFTLEVPQIPFQIRKPIDTKGGHYVRISLSGSDVVFAQATRPFDSQ